MLALRGTGALHAREEACLALEVEAGGGGRRLGAGGSLPSLVRLAGA